ncbi:hypothetical protein [Mycoplasmoides pirum]|uniref:hypothetical protein n=1 Tax=Mycoplasmoides pirum TaxID=2122 RepID=UPI0004867AD0|nr:hypothetical protein [Mycoplasmoides pirum]
MSKLFKYQYTAKGNQPTPMIAMYIEPNLDVYNEPDYTTSYGEWNDTNNCVWTIGAYLIYDENQVIAYKFTEFSNLTWLLRYINKKLIIFVDEKTKKIIDKYNLDEFVLIE